MKRTLAFTLFTLAFLSGCANMGQRETAGTVIGGAAGALIGSQFGGGSGQLIGTGIGAVAGSVVGNSVGKEMDKKD